MDIFHIILVAILPYCYNCVFSYTIYRTLVWNKDSWRVFCLWFLFVLMDMGSGQWTVDSEVDIMTGLPKEDPQGEGGHIQEAIKENWSIKEMLVLTFRPKYCNKDFDIRVAMSYAMNSVIYMEHLRLISDPNFMIS